MNFQQKIMQYVIGTVTSCEGVNDRIRKGKFKTTYIIALWLLPSVLFPVNINNQIPLKLYFYERSISYRIYS